jgi:hypothetical protein
MELRRIARTLPDHPKSTTMGSVKRAMDRMISNE